MELIVRQGDREEKVRIHRSGEGYDVIVGDRTYRLTMSTGPSASPETARWECQRTFDELGRPLRDITFTVVDPPRPSTRLTTLAATTKTAQSRGMAVVDLAPQLAAEARHA